MSIPKQPELTEAMEVLLAELNEILSNPVVEAAYNEAVSNVQKDIFDLETQSTIPNPWAGTTVEYFINYFKDWFTFLPSPTSGLGKIVPFTWFYINNQSAFFFLNTFESKSVCATKYSKEIFNWTVKFIKARGEFMDSHASAPSYLIKEWETFLGSQMQDYVVPEGGYRTFNEFFTRKLKDQSKSRPIIDDSPAVVVASGDTEINFIESNLALETDLKVKTRQINVAQLLGNSDLAHYFENGTALSCVLMPNNYHHYHSPVDGEIVESKDIPGIYNGIVDGEDWFNKGNIGESTTDFSIFEDFHRAYYIVDTKQYGYVAIVPVGLNTISKIRSLIPYTDKLVEKGETPVRIKKGDELGHFAYGGSLNIILFEPGVFSSLSVLMGQRLGEMSAPSRLKSN
ncbi:phosphatidylserine decarboxylase [Pseudoalteromonas sp. MMG024]|uniref:phosphatidylserine decarboxylase n=1 Tax=Pseudoalteromonas sp. MMG024 TaxID=2909980 RepID=UPI001F43E875|nr:phosphatidylserine decarboxylase [Pseudoalteromonas sp. MMG024]MCF6456192.1 phosphatidylserine decarboxylase [Pseudoalteromonas sp. MMG024]